MTYYTDLLIAQGQSLQLEDRCAPRTRVKMPAMLRRSGATGFKVTVYDISTAGFSCDAVTSIPKGTLCWLTLPGLSGLQSEVMWNDGRTVGCAFSNLLNQAVLDRLLAKHGSASL